MNYKYQYYKIIDYRKNNPLPDDVYGENHHIKPKSIYPQYKNDKDNIVRLSAEEHFKAHYYLWKYYKEELKDKVNARKMCFAFSMMKRIIQRSNNIEEMSRLYSEVREELSNITSLRNFNNKYHFGKHLTDETKRKISESKKGRHHTEEFKRKLSDMFKGEKGSFYGRHHTEESKRKISESKKGRHHTEESKRKLSESLRGRHQSEEWIRKRSESRKKPIIQYTKDNEFIREWKSTTDIEIETKINHSLISACCKGRYKTAGGYIWKYKENLGE